MGLEIYGFTGLGAHGLRGFRDLANLGVEKF